MFLATTHRAGQTPRTSSQFRVLRVMEACRDSHTISASQAQQTDNTCEPTLDTHSRGSRWEGLTQTTPCAPPQRRGSTQVGRAEDSGGSESPTGVSGPLCWCVLVFCVLSVCYLCVICVYVCVVCVCLSVRLCLLVCCFCHYLSVHGCRMFVCLAKDSVPRSSLAQVLPRRTSLHTMKRDVALGVSKHEHDKTASGGPERFLQLGR